MRRALLAVVWTAFGSLALGAGCKAERQPAGPEYGGYSPPPLGQPLPSEQIKEGFFDIAVMPDGRTVRGTRDEQGLWHLTPIPKPPGRRYESTYELPFLWPPIIDSHVHLVYWEVAKWLKEDGVLVAIDLGAPLDELGKLRAAPIDVRFSGPMLTRPEGYPLYGWGEDGYGIGCDSTVCVEKVVADLSKAGASVIKLALGEHGLAPELVAPAVAAAHRLGLKVAAHALSDKDAALAAEAGCDLLAHTPVERLSQRTVEAWKGRAVISTLAAFGRGKAALDNLGRLRTAGATILYGTDLGNDRTKPAYEVLRDEVEALHLAGFDDDAITAAMRTTPARYWGTDVRPGPLVMLNADPRTVAWPVLPTVLGVVPNVTPMPPLVKAPAR